MRDWFVAGDAMAHGQLGQLPCTSCHILAACRCLQVIPFLWIEPVVIMRQSSLGESGCCGTSVCLSGGLRAALCVRGV
jgi:hypothetical protein